MINTPRPVRIDGDVAYVTLTKGYEAIIDAEDAHLIGKFNWYALVQEHTVYACRKKGRSATKYMHREIIPASDVFFVDHKNRNGLDNRKSNLRFADAKQNKQNSCVRSDSKSKIKGVAFVPSCGKWRARIKCAGKVFHLGYHEDIQSAKAAYEDASKKLHLEFSRTE